LDERVVVGGAEEHEVLLEGGDVGGQGRRRGRRRCGAGAGAGDGGQLEERLDRAEDGELDGFLPLDRVRVVERDGARFLGRAAAGAVAGEEVGLVRGDDLLGAWLLGRRAYFGGFRGASGGGGGGGFAGGRGGGGGGGRG